MDEVLARRAWGVVAFAVVAFLILLRFECTIRNAAASVVVVAASLSDGRAF